MTLPAMDTNHPSPIDPQARIGHVHLKVADLDRAVAFYSGVLGFEVTQRWGGEAAFLSAGGYHHHLGLNTWQRRRSAAGPGAHSRSGGRSPAPPASSAASAAGSG